MNLEQFWNKVSPRLRREESKNSLFLGLLNSFRATPADLLYFDAIFENETLGGALICVPYGPRKTLLPSPVVDSEVAQRLLVNFKKSGVIPTDLVGEAATATMFRDLFLNDAWSVNVKMHQGVYVCRTVRMPVVNYPYTFRVAAESDVDTIAHWVDGFQIETLPHDPRVDPRATAEARIKAKNFYVVERDGLSALNLSAMRFTTA